MCIYHFLFESKLLKRSSFTGAWVWEKMFYKSLPRIVFAFPVSAKF